MTTEHVLDLKVDLHLSYTWGRDPAKTFPPYYRPLFGPCSLLAGTKGVEANIHIRTHPIYLDLWVDLLVSDLSDQYIGFLYCLWFCYGQELTLNRNLSVHSGH